MYNRDGERERKRKRERKKREMRGGHKGDDELCTSFAAAFIFSLSFQSSENEACVIPRQSVLAREIRQTRKEKEKRQKKLLSYYVQLSR